MTTPASTPAVSLPTPRVALPIVHAVTTDAIVALPDFLDRASAVMHALGPRGAVQLRAHRTSGARVFALARALVELQERTGAWLVVNDRLDVALAIGARGVQLTSRSIGVRDARRVAALAAQYTERSGAGPAIGASVHAVEEAEHAAREGADWVVAGHVFGTPSHAGAEGRGRAFVRSVVERLGGAAGTPVVAIGGVLPTHFPELRALGVYGAAAIRGIWEASDAAQAATDYLSWYDATDGHGGAR
jgi:thiamine-phosphate diphosphorylase